MMARAASVCMLSLIEKIYIQRDSSGFIRSRAAHAEIGVRQAGSCALQEAAVRLGPAPDGFPRGPRMPPAAPGGDPPV